MDYENVITYEAQVTRAIMELVENKIGMINLAIESDGFDAAAKTKQYHELYGIKQAAAVIGIEFSYSFDGSKIKLD